MRKLFAYLFACLAVNNLCAQGPASFCNANSCFQQNACYDDTAIDSTSYVFALTDKIFGNPASYKLNLRITVYSPCALPAGASVPYNPSGSRLETVTPACSGCKRPFILLVHGGGFSFGCRLTAENECREFAKRGYVAATIDYRLGWINSGQSCYTGLGANQFCLDQPTCDESSRCTDSTSMHAAMYKAFQDGFAALRYMAYYSSQFNIDTNYFYLGGQSAGSIVAANLAYMNQAEFNTALPDLVNMSGQNILGGVNSHGNSLQASYKVKGLYNCWGALRDATFIRGTGDRIPMIAFHCKNDNVVPYGNDGIVLAYACPGGELGVSDGSLPLYNRIKTIYPNQVATEFYHQDFGGHGGILSSTPAQRLKRIELAVCFFRKCAQGYTGQVDFDLTNGDNTTVDCSAAAATVRTSNETLTPIIATDGRHDIISTYTLDKTTHVQITVYDLNSRPLATYDRVEEKGNYRREMSVNGVPGVYVVAISYDGKNKATQKVALVR